MITSIITGYLADCQLFFRVSFRIKWRGFVNIIWHTLGMDQLAGLTEDMRKLAFDRFLLMQPILKSASPWNFILEINSLEEVNQAVVDDARDSLVIAQT